MMDISDDRRLVNECIDHLGLHRSLDLVNFMWDMQIVQEYANPNEYHAAVNRVRHLLLENPMFSESTQLGVNNNYYRIRFDPNFDLYKSTVDANTSSVITNDSTQRLHRFLRRSNIIALFIAAITGAFVAFQFFRDASPDLQPINKQLEQIMRSQDSMQKFQKGIDSCLRKAVEDSFYQKHK